MENDLNYVMVINERMRNYNFMLSYRGNFSHQITKSILSLTEKQLDHDGTEMSVKKKVFNVMVECLQNICKHSNEFENNNTPALFMIGRISDTFVIYSSNLINNENIIDFDFKLKTINSLTPTELKEFYINVIKEGRLNDVGGAGLGLIDIAKKTGKQLDYDFFEIDEKNSFFTLRTFVNNSKNLSLNDFDDQIMPMSSVYDFHNLMATNNIIMAFEGDFNQDITKTVLTMTERTIDDAHSSVMVKKKVFNVMVEMLQNICKHQHNVLAENIRPTFMVGEQPDNYLIVSGNPIDNSNIEKIKNKIDLVNSLNEEELKELYKKTRLAAQISNVGGAGLGFIDMARKSGNKLLYHFYQINNSVSYFVFKTIITKKEI